MMSAGTSNYLPLESDTIKLLHVIDSAGGPCDSGSMCPLDKSPQAESYALTRTDVPTIVIIDDLDQVKSESERLTADVDINTSRFTINRAVSERMNSTPNKSDCEANSSGHRLVANTNRANASMTYEGGCAEALIAASCQSQSRGKSARDKANHIKSRTRFADRCLLQKRPTLRRTTSRKESMNYFQRRCQSHPEKLNLVTEDEESPMNGGGVDNWTANGNGPLQRKSSFPQESFHHSNRSFPFTDQETRKFNDDDLDLPDFGQAQEEDLLAYELNEPEESQEPNRNLWNNREFRLRDQFFSFFQASDNKLAMKLFGSRNALLKEKRRQMAAKTWIIHPCSNFR